MSNSDFSSSAATVEAIARIRAALTDTDPDRDFSGFDPVEDMRLLLAEYDRVIAPAQSVGMREALLNAIDSPTVAALAAVFSPRNNALTKSYSEQIAEILAPRLAAQPPAAPVETLAEGCCSATRPCSHQKASPQTICDTCREAQPRLSAASTSAEITMSVMRGMKDEEERDVDFLLGQLADCLRANDKREVIKSFRRQMIVVASETAQELMHHEPQTASKTGEA